MKNYEKNLIEKAQSSQSKKPSQSINDEKITSTTVNFETSNSESKFEKIKLKKKKKFRKRSEIN